MVADFPPFLTAPTVASTLFFLALVLIIVNYTLSRLSMPKNKRLGISLLISAVLVGWFAVVYVFGQDGFFAKTPITILGNIFIPTGITIPNIAFTFMVLFIGIIISLSSKTLQIVFDAIPQHWLIAIQTYRLVGYGFLVLYQMGLLPGEFAFPAGGGDMIVGFTAPFVAFIYLIKKSYSKKLAIGWNIIGLADLVIAVGIGILGYPIPFQVLPTDPSTQLLSLFPLIIIPAFAVPLAGILHLFSLRVLMNKR